MSIDYKNKTYIAIPPGATIKKQISDRKMTQKELAARMEMSEKHISHLINGDIQLTPDVAMRLEMVLSLPAKLWNNLESEYRETLLKIEEENKLEADEIEADNFARENLISTNDFEEFVKSYSFTKKSIIDFSKEIGIAPGILVGRLQKERFIPFSHFNDLKIKYELK